MENTVVKRLLNVECFILGMARQIVTNVCMKQMMIARAQTIRDARIELAGDCLACLGICTATRTVSQDGEAPNECELCGGTGKAAKSK